MIPIYVGGTTMIGGAVFLLFALLLTRKCLILNGCGIRTRAVVVGSIEDGESSYPLVEFVDLHEVKHRVRLPVGGINSPLGRNMEIIYHRDNPSFALGTSFVQFWLFPLACFGVAGFLEIIGLAMSTGWLRN